MPRRFLLLLSVVLIALVADDDAPTKVVRATLGNGLRVVIVRDPLAPVATLEQNYLTGGQDTPAGFPGMAHAQEHMAFRGARALAPIRLRRSTPNSVAVPTRIRSRT